MSGSKRECLERIYELNSECRAQRAEIERLRGILAEIARVADDVLLMQAAGDTKVRLSVSWVSEKASEITGARR